MSHRFDWKGMSADGTSVTLKKYDGNCPTASYATADWIQANSRLLATGIVLDVETTGLNQTADKIIEIALRKFRFNRDTGDVVSVNPPYVALQDPGMPLSPKIQSITGLHDEMLKGKSIDWNKVGSEITEAEITIAHNAAFDRPFVERYCQAAIGKVWACSFSQVDWQSKGYSSAKLEMLSIHHGFFVEAHRALNDVDALLYLISMKDSTTNGTYLLEIAQNALKPAVLLVARNSPFETKDLLKERGYFWNPTVKSWQKQLVRENLEAETQWLESVVYKGRFRGETRDIPLNETFRNVSP